MFVHRQHGITTTTTRWDSLCPSFFLIQTATQIARHSAIRRRSLPCLPTSNLGTYSGEESDRTTDRPTDRVIQSRYVLGYRVSQREEKIRETTRDRKIETRAAIKPVFCNGGSARRGQIGRLDTLILGLVDSVSSPDVARIT